MTQQEIDIIKGYATEDELMEEEEARRHDTASGPQDCCAMCCTGMEMEDPDGGTFCMCSCHIDKEAPEGK